MDRDEARNEILKIILKDAFYVSPGRMADLITKFLAPELEKAKLVDDSVPDFSYDHTMMEFLRWFWKEKLEMWDEFEAWAYWQHDDKADDEKFTPWLFSLSDNEPRMMTLLSEWLSLPEVREKFGWTPCDGSCDACEYPDMAGCDKNKHGWMADWAKEE